MATIMKCPCGDDVCNKWLVSPGADFQGCGWDKETAQAVVDLLNAREEVAQRYTLVLDTPKILESDNGQA